MTGRADGIRGGRREVPTQCCSSICRKGKGGGDPRHYREKRQGEFTKRTKKNE